MRSRFPRRTQRAGIEPQVRVVDAVQYDRRRLTYDFDMIEYRWDQSLSPGNEQAFYWGSAAADAARHPQLHGRARAAAVDAMIAAHAEGARSRADFVSAVRALDRVLMSGLCGAAVPSAGAMGRALAIDPASGGDVALWLSAGNLVARAVCEKLI